MFFEGPKGVKGMWLETIEFGEGEWPEVEEWFPAREGVETAPTTSDGKEEK